jgi:hypothetical protein
MSSWDCVEQARLDEHLAEALALGLRRRVGGRGGRGRDGVIGQLEQGLAGQLGQLEGGVVRGQT